LGILRFGLSERLRRPLICIFLRISVGVEFEPHPKQLSRGVSTTAKCFSIGIAREAQDSRSRKNAQLPGFFGP
jgi:hypothetical protein